MDDFTLINVGPLQNFCPSLSVRLYNFVNVGDGNSAFGFCVLCLKKQLKVNCNIVKEKRFRLTTSNTQNFNI